MLNLGLTVMATFLQRLSHLNVESCTEITSMALSFDDIKSSQASTSAYLDVLNPPNRDGLPGCKLLQSIYVSRCVGLTIDSIETFIRALGRPLKVSILSRFIVRISDSIIFIIQLYEMSMSVYLL